MKKIHQMYYKLPRNSDKYKLVDFDLIKYSPRLVC